MIGTQIRPRVSEISFKFDVPNVSKLDTIYSPEYTVYGVPWQISVYRQKSSNDEMWLVARLHCARKGASKQWSHVAVATFKLLPFDSNVTAIEKQTYPWVYDFKGIGYGADILRWEEIFDGAKKFVKNDTIKFDIKIEMADPDERNKSELILEEISRSCAVGCKTKLRLTVTNIENLTIIQSVPFKLRNQPWVLLVSKDRFNENVDVRLECVSKSQTFSCILKMSIKLISMNPERPPLKQKQKKHHLKSLDNLMTDDFISWDELHNPNNGFVNNNSIVIEVKIKSEQPQHPEKAKTTTKSATKRKATGRTSTSKGKPARSSL